MDTPTLWRTALLQLIAVAVLSLALGLALTHDFSVDWGWIAGPASWMLCVAFIARVLGPERPGMSSAPAPANPARPDLVDTSAFRADDGGA